MQNLKLIWQTKVEIFSNKVLPIEAVLNTVSSRFEENKISAPDQDVLNVRLRSYRARSRQTGLCVYFQKGLLF